VTIYVIVLSHPPRKQDWKQYGMLLLVITISITNTAFVLSLRTTIASWSMNKLPKALNAKRESLGIFIVTIIVKYFAQTPDQRTTHSLF